MQLRLASPLILAFLVTACGISTPSDNTIENVSGTIPVGGSDFHSYSFGKNGEVEVRITTLSPSPSASLGMALGQVSGASCVPMSPYFAALVANRTVPFGYVNKGDYCLVLYDPGSVLTAPTTYAGTISHP
jgi:hypothetical protein